LTANGFTVSAELDATRSTEELGRALARLGARAEDVRRVSATITVATLFEVADLLGDLVLEHPWRRRDLEAVVASLATGTGLPPDLVRSQLQARAALDPRLLELSPLLAVETQVSMLHALAPVDEISVWIRQADGLRLVFRHGGGEPSRRERLAARRALRGDRADHEDLGLVNAVPILRWQRPTAALAFRSSKRDRERAIEAARQTARALAPVLERDELLLRNASRERALVEGGERLLTRVGFDLHDGAIQDVAALAAEVRLFRDQLKTVVPASVSDRVLARFEDIDARLFAVDRALRQTVHSLESPTVGNRPLDELLRLDVNAFANQTDISAGVTTRGDFTALTASQRIAILRIVQESLTNAREHSGASEVSVSLSVRREQIHAEITDNGRGFDVERTLVKAARNGRLGLVGMSERVRLLGGRFDVQSRPGGPTTVSVVLPAWRPVTVEQTASQAAEPVSVG
jgi:signal transduction histidine kinase